MVNIIEYIKSIIKLINNSSNLRDIAKNVNANLINNYGYDVNSTREEKIYNILVGYKNKEIEEATFVNLIKDADSINSNLAFVGAKGKATAGIIGIIDEPSSQVNLKTSVKKEDTTVKTTQQTAEKNKKTSGIVEVIKEDKSQKQEDSKKTASSTTSVVVDDVKDDTKKQESSQNGVIYTKVTVEEEKSSLKDDTKKETVIDDKKTSQEVLETTKSTTVRETSSTSTSKASQDTPIIDMDTEVINKVSSDYSSVKESVSNNKIEISNDEVRAAAQTLISIIEEGNGVINDDLNLLKNEMIESVASIEYVDGQIKNADISNADFSDLWEYTGKLMTYGVKEADESFFVQNGYQVTNGVVKIGEYSYNVRNSRFYVNGKDIGKTYFYVPVGVKDCSKLNTLTMLSGIDSRGVERFRDVGDMSNSIIVAFENCDSGYLKQPQNVAATTKFINTVAKTDLSKCQNVIAGGSRFGARSLKIAAETGDLYQTVVCVNNAVLVKGKNAKGGGKEAFDNLEQLRKLNGKNIYFISSKDDPNLTMRYNGSSEFDRCNDVTKCYVYTGMNLLLENCPLSQVYFISNNDNPAFANISAPNYYYGRDLWRQVAKSDSYSDHGSLHNILNDLCTSNLIGYNGYNSSGSTA